MIWRKGNPLYNLEVRVTLDPLTIENQGQLLNYANTFSFAQKLFEGKKHVTEGGYILSGYESHEEDGTFLPVHRATVNFNLNYKALSILKEVIDKKSPNFQATSLFRLQCALDELQVVLPEGLHLYSHLYLPMVRAKHQL